MNYSSLDLPSLHLLRLVATHRGITAAAEAAGLSQSALSRHLQRIEAELGLRMFARTTRRLELTAAGAALLRDTEQVPHIVARALRRLREEHLEQERIIHLGVARSVSLAHVPGLLHAQPRGPDAPKLVVSQPKGKAALNALVAGGLDLAIATLPQPLPSSVRVTHRIEDAFTIVTPAAESSPVHRRGARFNKWAAAQRWLLPPTGTQVRARIDSWSAKQNLTLLPAMEIDSFDLMVQLVALGVGTAAVPRRAVSAFPRKTQILKIHPGIPLQRELVILCQSQSPLPDHLTTFIENVLFS